VSQIRIPLDKRSEQSDEISFSKAELLGGDTTE